MLSHINLLQRVKKETNYLLNFSKIAVIQKHHPSTMICKVFDIAGISRWANYTKDEIDIS